MIEGFEDLGRVMKPAEWRVMADKIYTHKDASVKEFHDAFDDFCTVHASRGHNFRHPEDYQAMLQEEFYKDLISPKSRQAA